MTSQDPHTPGRPLAGWATTRLGAGLATAVIGLAGCGGGGSSSDGSASTSPNTNPTTGTNTSGVACTLAERGTQLLSYSNNSATVSESLPYTYQWSCTSTQRTVAGNGVPNHAVSNGRFATRVSAQVVSQTFALNPSGASSASTSTAIKEPGFAINSVKFDPGTAGTCVDTATSHANGCNDAGGTGTWRMEALPGTVSPWLFDFGTDTSNAHVQPNGQYHYHGMPEGLIAKLNKASTSSMTLVGWAKDGYPIYARYGYSSAADAKSALKVMTGSYRVKATPTAGRPATAFFAMGHFQQDWEYAAGTGDLDECNGRTGATPEFPNGTYHYYITDNYPFIQRCVKGTVAAGS